MFNNKNSESDEGSRLELNQVGKVIRFKCQYCLNKFTTKAFLTHLNQCVKAPSTSDRFKCQYCLSKFTAKAFLTHLTQCMKGPSTSGKLVFSDF